MTKKQLNDFLGGFDMVTVNGKEVIVMTVMAIHVPRPFDSLDEPIGAPQLDPIGGYKLAITVEGM